MLSDEEHVATLLPAAGPQARVRLRLRLMGKTSGVTFYARSKDQSWAWRVSPNVARRIREIVAPAAGIDLTIRGEGLRPFNRERMPLATTVAFDLGDVELVPVQRVRGVVLSEETQKPVAQAEVTVVGTKQSVTTGDDGRFELAVEGHFPERVAIRHAGYADAEVPLEFAMVDVEVAPVFMAAGASIRVDLRTAGAKVRTADLLDAGKHVLASTRIRDDSAVFEHIGSGRYFVVLKGEHPLERRTVAISIPHGERHVQTEVKVEGAALEGRVVQGDRAVGVATLDVFNMQQTWRSTITTDADGRFETPSWELGTIAVLVRRPSIDDPYYATKTLDGSSTTYWEIAIPDGTIRGRVVDAVDGKPLAGVIVFDDSFGGSASRGRWPATTDGDGRFVFSGVAAGRHRIYIEPKGYLVPDAVTLDLPEGLAERVVDFALEHGREAALVIQESDDRPSAGARLLTIGNNDGTSAGEIVTADAAGKVVLRGKPATQPVWFVVSALTGAFTALAIDFDHLSGDAALAVRLPPTAGPVTISIRDHDQPVAGCTPLLSVDGHFIPPVVIDAVIRLQGAPAASGSSGTVIIPRLPLGDYEVRCVASGSSLSKIFLQPDQVAHAVLRVGASGGAARIENGNEKGR